MATPMTEDMRNSGWAGQVQWAAILAGAFAGFAATVILATLGAAIGITAGASAVDETARSMENTAVGVGIGAVVWTIITAIVVGFVGGSVLNRTARYDRPYLPLAFGTITWAVGIFLALLVASSGMSGAAGAVGGGLAGVGSNPSVTSRIERSVSNGARGNESMTARPMTDEERAKMRDAADKAAKTAAGLAWVALGAQLISLTSTMLAARWQKSRDIPVKFGAQPA